MSGEKWRRWIQTVSGAMLAWIYPSNIYCISCGDFIKQDKSYSLCDRCVQTLHWISGHRCPTCGKELEEGKDRCYDCETTKRFFDFGMSCVQYGRMEKKMIHRFKYKEGSYMAPFLGKLMAERILAEEGMAETVDFVVAVPMYRKKEGIRGYNQAELLAKEVAASLSLPYYRHCLTRCRETAPMNRLGAEERRENVKQAFVIEENRKECLKDGVALLVDDVYTTGSTADACAEILKQGGVAKVVLLSFASGADRQRKKE